MSERFQGRITPAPDTPEFAINQEYRFAINAIRSTLANLSNKVRKEVAKWCVKAETQPDLLWDELFKILQNSPSDFQTIIKSSALFKNYAERQLNGRIMDIDLTPPALESFTSEEQQENQATSLQIITPNSPNTISNKVDKVLAQIKRPSIYTRQPTTAKKTQTAREDK
jgi:hypothetical protein